MIGTETDYQQTTLAFFRQLYGDNAPGYLALWTLPGSRTHWVPAQDLEGAALAAVWLSANHDVYFGVGLHAKDLGPHSRGKADGVIAIPGLWADVDVWQDEKRKGVPTLDDALDLVHQLEHRPSLLVNSGHGLHAYWLFRQLWVFADDAEHRQAEAMLGGFKAALGAKAAAFGWKLDAVQDLARVLRPPGTWNRKHKEAPAPVRVIGGSTHA